MVFELYVMNIMIYEKPVMTVVVDYCMHMDHDYRKCTYIAVQIQFCIIQMQERNRCIKYI